MRMLSGSDATDTIALPVNSGLSAFSNGIPTYLSQSVREKAVEARLVQEGGWIPATRLWGERQPLTSILDGKLRPFRIDDARPK